MAAPYLAVSDNPFAVGMSTDVYIPDQLIGGDLKLVTTTQTVNQNATVLARGTVMGRITATGNYIPSVETAVDGSQTPSAILVDVTDATLGAVQAGLYVMGEFNFGALTYDASWGTGATAYAALFTPLRGNDIFLKNAIPGAIPSNA